jgi:3-oxoacyl-[acyl-carrier protein] reductase
VSSHPELQGKVAVVTGGSRGIGLETATRLAKNGASVGIVARGQQAIDDAVASIQAAGGRAVGVAADAISLQATVQVRDRIESELGGVDLVVAFAGSGDARPGARAERGRVALHR